MGREVAGREAGRDAERGADVHRQRRRLCQRRGALPLRVGDLVPPARAHVQSDVTEQIEGRLEALVRVAFVQETDDEVAALIDQPLLQFAADVLDRGAIRLREVQLLQLGIQLTESGSDPAVECLDLRGHGSR